MRFHLVAALLMASVAMPAAAQKPSIDKRVEKLEGEIRAVQRKVFPAGNVEPEIRAETAVEAPGGVPAGSAVADLNARVDALEAQLARLTGQNEENAHRARQIEEAFTKFKGDAEFRLAQIEGGGTAPAAAAPSGGPAPAESAAREIPSRSAPATRGGNGGDDQPAPTQASISTPAVATSTDEAETAYLTGFRMWEGGRYAEAAPALEAMAKQWPRHRRASYAQNLAGRAYLDDGKPATAAKIFLSNYQANPKGDRAADSLYFLGQALAQLDKAAEACKVYDELADVYPTMRDWLKQRLPQARTEAKCEG